MKCPNCNVPAVKVDMVFNSFMGCPVCKEDVQHLLDKIIPVQLELPSKDKKPFEMQQSGGAWLHTITPPVKIGQVIKHIRIGTYYIVESARYDNDSGWEILVTADPFYYYPITDFEIDFTAAA